MKTIYIETSDEALIGALASADLPGVEITARLQAAITVRRAITYTIHLAETVAVGLFTSWLYDQIKDHCAQESAHEFQTKERPTLAELLSKIEKIERDRDKGIQQKPFCPDALKSH